jgi:hypothetical protein
MNFTVACMVCIQFLWTALLHIAKAHTYFYMHLQSHKNQGIISHMLLEKKRKTITTYNDMSDHIEQN